MLELLTVPETLAQLTQTHRFMAEVASNKVDFEGVPVDFKTIDVVVMSPTKQAIELLIAAADWLKGYSLVSFWTPEDGCTEF
jgi:hypothetical protein